MHKKIISTEQAPQAIGTYSQAVQVDHLLFVSGQIPLDPKTMQLISTDISLQIDQAFKNLQAVVEAANASLNDIVKLTIYLIDLNHFAKVNEIMGRYFDKPYPARAALGVASLPKQAQVEIEAIAYIKRL